MLNTYRHSGESYLLEDSEAWQFDERKTVALPRQPEKAHDSAYKKRAFLCEYAESEPALISLPERRAIRGEGNRRYIRLLGKDEIPELVLAEKPWRGRKVPARTALAKRVMDICGALLALLLAAPLILAISAWLAVQGGPILFAQTRVGKDGKHFRCYKFRTMRVGAQAILDEMLQKDAVLRSEWKTTRKLANDPRITRLGGFLRRTSLDELPQLINVLKGDMSLVGPRPILPNEMQKYRGYIGYYLSVKPALTGLWQINGRNNTTYDRRIALDTTYVRKNSIWLDFAIVARTIPVLLRAEGAY